MSTHTATIVEGIPLLCRRCGGPVEAEADGAELRCPYCGERDRLPDDLQARASELRRRLDQVRAAAVQLEGFGQTLVTFYEGPQWVTIVGMNAALAAWLLFQALGRASRGLDLVTLVAAGFVVGVVSALLSNRWSYRRTIRPLLFARPPRVEGQPARCRGCGADLPRTSVPIIPCSYCDTRNLLSEDLQRERERLLAEESAFYQERARGLRGRAIDVSGHFRRVLWVSGVASGVLVIAIGVVIRVLGG